VTFARAARVLLFVAFTAVLCLVASCTHFSLSAVPEGRRVRVVSTWKDGVQTSRRVLTNGEPPPAPGPPDGGAFVVEEGVAEAPMVSWPWFFEMGVVPGQDGVIVTVGDKAAVISVDELLSAHAYDHTQMFAEAGLGLGVDRAVILANAAKNLGLPAQEVDARASFRRIRFERHVTPSAPAAPRVTAATLSEADVHTAIVEASRYLSRNLDPRGKFRYLVEASTNQEIPGYSWPRHAGATFFLAQAAGVEKEPIITYATLRAAAIMRDERMVPCGEHTCIAEDDQAEIGSAALALIAFSEIVRRDIDASYKVQIKALAEFLRSQQRPDGEFQHLYDRTEKKPLDVQLLYFSGEATLALARAHRITNDPRDLDAATRGLARLVGSGWHFFGDRYYFSEEHWTCQAMEDLWERAPNQEALTFCKRWHEYQRRMQYGAGEHAMDAEGAFGVGNFVSPRLTPASSRGEAAGATLLAVMRQQAQTGTHDPERELLSQELDSAVAFVVRHQFRPGPAHLFASAGSMFGAMPGSAVDWQIRIDYLQHAGSMMVRWLEINGRAEPSSMHPTR
jgi:hypothetical protein